MKFLVLVFAIAVAACSHESFRAEPASSATSQSRERSEVPNSDLRKADASSKVDPKTVSEPADSGTGGADAPPACLNIQDGEWHVEFDGRRLLLAESGQPRALSLDGDAKVECAKLQLVKNARQGAALIEFVTEAKGTSVGVSDRYLGVASVKSAKWIVEPILLQRFFDTGDRVETREYSTAQWSTDKDNAPILTLIDAKTGHSQTFKP